jgi:hypothetical protein
MLEFFQRAKRGGMCSVGEWTFANVYNLNNYCIIGFDMNALYPTAMTYPMPLGDYKWMSPDIGHYT